MNVTTPRLYLSATRKSSGKTTISAGLCGALANRGLAVQTFKKGPDYIDPMWLGRTSGRACYNVDFHTQSRDEIRQLCASKLTRADIGIVEGNKGLFDGVDLEGADCNASMANLLGAPVVLVVDCEGMTRGIAPLLNGYRGFDDAVQIAGVILNRLGGARHESKLRSVIERYADVEVVGAVQRHPDLEIGERHLGLITDRESKDADSLIGRLSRIMEDQLDVERLMAIANSAATLPLVETPEPAEKLPLHIGVARDSAFCFYYADDLEGLEAQAEQVTYFSPLHDSSVPDCDALIFGGGFPETHAGLLQANHAMRTGVRRFANSERPVYAECGGLMYLANELLAGEQRYQLSGALPLVVKMTDRPVGRGYVQLAPTDRHPWSLKGGGTIPAHEFHYSAVEPVGEQPAFGYSVRRGYGVDGANDGVVHGNVFASYAHLRNTMANPWVSRFLQSIQRCHSAVA